MKKNKSKKGALGLAFGALLAVAALVWLGQRSGYGADGTQAVDGVPVQRGNLRISVVEKGNLKAANSVTLKSELEGQTTVLYLIEEGVTVRPGDLLCELDTTEFDNRRVQQDIQVQNAEASYIKAKQNHEIQVSENLSDTLRAERELEFAKIDLDKYVEGDWPQEERAANEAILLADEELTRATQDLAWSEKLAARGFLEQTQLDADRLAKTRAEIAVNQAKRALELLQEFEYPRTRKEFEADVDEKRRELERVKLQAKAKIVDFEAEVRTSKARFDLEMSELAKIDDQIAKAKIHAPVAGMVVYAMEDRGRYGNGTPMQEGASVRERQEIITIPSTDGFVCEASLHESVLEKVRVGMPCLITIDALGSDPFPGEVAFKAVLPDQNSWWANPDLRVYRTEVKILAQDPRLRPGMSSSIEILVDELEGTLFVPVQAIFMDAGSPICLVSDGKIEKRPVVVGENNGKHAAIEEGLEEGEVVLLSLPPGFSLAPASEEVRERDGTWPEGGQSPRGAHPGGDARGALSSEARDGSGSAPTAAHGARGGRAERGSPHSAGRPGGGKRPEREAAEEAGDEAVALETETAPAAAQTAGESAVGANAAQEGTP